MYVSTIYAKHMRSILSICLIYTHSMWNTSTLLQNILPPMKTLICIKNIYLQFQKENKKAKKMHNKIVFLKIH